MRLLLTLFIFASLSLNSLAQYKVEGTISGYLNKNLILLEYFGDKHIFIDSTGTDDSGWFSFELRKDAPAGLYSLAIDNSPLFNFIFNTENIILKFEPDGFSPPEFIQSVENLIYYDYLAQSAQYDQKAGMLIDILQYYPKTDSFYLFTGEHFENLQAAHREYTDRIIQAYPATLVSHIVRSDRPVVIPKDMIWDDYLSFNQSHYFDDVDFGDTSLINTNVFTAKAIDYLGFYSINSQNKELQEQVFIRAVDTVLLKAMENGKVYDFLMQYLIEGFEMYGFDRVISHIAENYEPANICVNEDRKSELQKRMENLRKLAIGNIAPDIVIENAQGEKLNLAGIDSELTVILFWASWCPHCNQMIPGLKRLYQEGDVPDFEILAISIDTSATDYMQALAVQQTAWINYAELNGWDSKAVVDYSIYATPTMFILDRNRKILGRPVSVSDLRYELEKLK
ncbi:MAG: redoxin domain-containing protein [Bacteroidales bacterium]|nr:redoxin domain-containing protein [Bacteroidales bacterium]